MLKKLIILLFLMSLAVTVMATGQFDRVNEIGVQELRVEGGPLDVEIHGGSRLGLEGYGENIPRYIEVEYERRGGTVRVWVKRKFPFFPTSGNGRLVFRVPGSIDLDIRTSSGSVDIREMNSNRFFAGVSSGNLRLIGLRSDFEARSSSGSIDIEDVRGSGLLEASSGRIEVRDVKGDINASSSSGSIRLLDIDGDIVVSTRSGRTTIDGAKGSIQAESTSGGISADAVWITGDSSFSSSSGGIDVDFGNPLSVFSFNLSSTSGRLRAGDLNADKSLIAGSGVYRITGETSSGGQRYR